MDRTYCCHQLNYSYRRNQSISSFFRTWHHIQKSAIVYAPMELAIKGKTILAVAAHADDLDFGCAGSIAVWAKQGAHIHYLILTDGSKGSEDTTISEKKLAKLRQKEQRMAAKVLGVKDVSFGGFTDGELINSPEVRYPIVKKIRQLKPDIIVTTDPTFYYSEEYGFINHPDHRNAGQATLDSVFPYARNAKTFPDLFQKGLAPHIVRDVLLISFVKGNFLVDISDTFEKKIQALKQHATQIKDVKMFRDMLQQRAMRMGERIGVKYAEGFARITLRN